MVFVADVSADLSLFSTAARLRFAIRLSEIQSEI